MLASASIITTENLVKENWCNRLVTGGTFTQFPCQQLRSEITGSNSRSGPEFYLTNKTQYPSVELWIHFFPVSFCGANSRYFSNFRHHLRGEWSWRIALLLTAFVCKSGNWIVLLPLLLFVKKLAIFNLRSSRIFQNTHSICRITEIQNSSLRLNKFIRGFSTIKSFFKMADG